MPYYSDGLPYYYGGAFSNHSSLMTGTPRALHTPLSRFSPHLSTITESPLSALRRYSPASVSTRPKRIIDTADIDVSTPRILSRDGNRQRNRLRRDRPTIKIRCQAMKDNPALREHNERHEKSVGELLVEKFLIKDKRSEEVERQLRMYHQVSLDRERNQQDLQAIHRTITRRMTRRRSSADIQLDPEQLEREVAYAQVQAEVLDDLVAQEQAEIENEVRRGTLIRKGTVRGQRFFGRSVEPESMSQEEEEKAASGLRAKKPLKKVKKRKKLTEKPSPPGEDQMALDKRRSSTSSEVSTEPGKDESVSEEEETRSKQMYKIEASNSAGDFSTVWLNASGGEGDKLSIEQFRESIKIPVPRKDISERSIDVSSVKKLEDEQETQIILPARKPYVKDTSRNSAYFTIKKPQEKLKKESSIEEATEIITNGITLASESKTAQDDQGDQNAMIKPPPTKTTELPKKKIPGSATKIIDDQQENQVPNKEPLNTNAKKIDRKLLGKKPIKTSFDKDEDASKTSDLRKKQVSQSTTPIASPKPKPMEAQRFTFEEASKSADTTSNTQMDIPSNKSMDTPKNEPKDTPSNKPLDTPKSGPMNASSSKPTVAPSNESITTPNNEPISTLTDKPIDTLKNEPSKAAKSRPMEAPRSEPMEIARTKEADQSARSKAANEKAGKTRADEATSRRCVVSIAGDTSENSASAEVSPSVARLPKASKINADENNAVEAPELSLRVPTYLANPAKVSGDVHVGAEFPGKAVNKAVTLNASASERVGAVGSSSAGESQPGRPKVVEDAATGAAKLGAKQTTLWKATKNEVQKVVPEKIPTEEKSPKSDDAKQSTDLSSGKIETAKSGGQATKVTGKGETSTIVSKTNAEKILDIGKTANEKSAAKIPEKEPEKSGRVDGEAVTSKDANLSVSSKTESEKASDADSKIQPKNRMLIKPNEVKKNDVADTPKPLKDWNVQKTSKIIPEKTPTAIPAKDANKPNIINKNIGLESQNRASNESPPASPITKTRPALKPLKLSSSSTDLPTNKPKNALGKSSEMTKALSKVAEEKPKPQEDVGQEMNGTLSKSTSSESIDFWNEIKPPESPQPPKPKLQTKIPARAKEPSSAPSKPSFQEIEASAGKLATCPIKEVDKKKETDLKISEAQPASPVVAPGNMSVIEERQKVDDSKPAPKIEEVAKDAKVGQTAASKVDKPKRDPRKKKNLVISISKDLHSTVKRTPLKREDSAASNSATATPDTSVPTSEVSTPICEIPVPLINIVSPPAFPKSEAQTLEDENEDPGTPTNELPESGIPKISKWNNQGDLSNLDDIENNETPTPTNEVSLAASPNASPGASPASSKKKKVIKRKKSSTKKSLDSEASEKEAKESRKESSSKETPSLKPPESKLSPKSSPKNSPTQRPIDLIRMFYTTPAALLTATPRDLSKVRRAKIKRRRHQSRTPSVSSDSTGSTTSTATIESTDGSGSTCTELDDDAEHKRMNSTRSNDSGFDGSPRISSSYSLLLRLPLPLVSWLLHSPSFDDNIGDVYRDDIYRNRWQCQFRLCCAVFLYECP
ncbi:hypothetical protein KM043_012829 [Ampulex compressa]|nr:hypothetical protein KM043_012829 [Ampulex compressa]